MSLHEMTLRDKEHQPFTSCSAAIAHKQDERNEIDRLIHQYFSSGGSINVIGKTVDAIIDPLPNPPKSNKNKAACFENKSIAVPPYKNRTTRRSPYGQNIRKRIDGSYWVRVGSVELGRHDRWTEDQAKGARDDYRKANGLPPVDY